MRFFDAHCDTIGRIVEQDADFVTGHVAGSPFGLHVTLPEMRRAGVCAQVFACWAWRGKYRGREDEVGLEMLRAVRGLCAAFPQDLEFTWGNAPVAGVCAGDVGEVGGKTAVIAALEGADPLKGDVSNLTLFYDEGVRLLTLAWGDNEFSGTVFGEPSGLTAAGCELVEACEELGVLVDVSHASDQAFADVCAMAQRPFVASHSNCRSLCPHPRNLTDRQIRALAESGGVMGINLGSGFLSAEFHERTSHLRPAFFESVASGEKSFEEAAAASSEALRAIPRPPLSAVVAHVRRAMDLGGEDCVGLGGDLDGVDSLPEGLDGVGHYPLIAALLFEAGLSDTQVEKVCYGNLARVFCELTPGRGRTQGL
jgi:membrane dipeptidase